MWIEPVARTANPGNSGPHWTILEANEFFALQSQLHSESYAAEASNKLAFAKPFRILLLTEAFPIVFETEQKAGHTSPSGDEEDHKPEKKIVIIALADEEKDIREHWKFLTLNVLPQMSQFDRVREQNDLYVFVTKKISAMATEEDLANLEAPGRRLRGTTLHSSVEEKDKGAEVNEAETFDGFKKLVSSVGDKSWEKEKNLLVADYECSLLVEIKRPGRLWITANNVYFLSEEQKTHVLLRIHDIIEISLKSLTQGTNDSIELSTSKSKFFFTEFSEACGPMGVEVVYNVLDSLWNAALYRIHSLSVTTLAEKENEDAEDTDTDDDSDFEYMMFRDVEPDESDNEAIRKLNGNEGVPPPSEDGSDRSSGAEDGSNLPKVVPSKPIDVRASLKDDLGRDSPSVSSRSNSPLSLSLERIGDVETMLKNSRSDDSGKDSEDEDAFSAPRRRRSRTSTLSSSFSALSSGCNLSYYASTELNRKSADDSPLFLPEPLSVEALLEQRKKDIFHRLFRLPLGEQLHEVLWSTFSVGSDRYTGHLFVTTNYICFHSVPIPLFGGVPDGTEQYDDYGGIPIGSVTEKKKSKVTLILSLEDMKLATLRVGNAKKEQLIAREEAELKKREDAIHSPRRKSMVESSKFKSPLGNINSPFYRSMQTLPHFEPPHNVNPNSTFYKSLQVLPHFEHPHNSGAETPSKSARTTSFEKEEPPATDPAPAQEVEGSAAPTKEHRASLPTSPEPSRKGGDPSSTSPTTTIPPSSSSKTEKNVRKMLERMLSDTAIEVNPSASSEDQQDLEAILKLGDAAEEGKELGTKSIRVLEKLVERKNKEIRKLVEERDLFRERAIKLETHLKELLGETEFVALYGTLPELGGVTTSTSPVTLVTDVVVTEASPGSPLAPKLILNDAPLMASGNVTWAQDEKPKTEGGENKPETEQSTNKPDVEKEDVKKSDVHSSVNSDRENDVKQPEAEHSSNVGNSGSPTKVHQDQDASVSSPEGDEGQEKETLSLHLDEFREECIVFRMRNDVKYIFAIEKKNFTAKVKDATALQDLIRELCAAVRPGAPESARETEKPREALPGIPQPMYQSTAQFSADYLEKQPYRLIIWERYFAAHGSDKYMVRHSDEIATLLFCYDLPDLRRGELWSIFSCASFYIQRGKGEYANILRSYEHTESEYYEAIMQDLDRSFPGHSYFATEEGMSKIKNVLLAYSWRNPHIGYTQGMNIIVALLLCFMDEESTFWTLCCICEVLFPEYYNNGFLGLIIDQRVFCELAQETVPEVCAIFNKRGIPLALIVAPWFMTLFIGHLTLESSLHVLSQLLFGGPESPMLFLVGLAGMKLRKQFILEHDDVNPVDMCHDIPCDELCKAVQEMQGITQERVRALRRKHRYIVVQEMMQQSAIETSLVEYTKPVHHVSNHRRGTLSFHPTPAVTPYPTPSTTPNTTPYSTPVTQPYTLLLSPENQRQPQSPEEAKLELEKRKQEIENVLRREHERQQEKEEKDKEEKQTKENDNDTALSPPVTSPLGSPPLVPRGEHASKDTDVKDRELSHRDRDQGDVRYRDRTLERRREREREKERRARRERERAEAAGKMMNPKPQAIRASGVNLAGLKIGQGTGSLPRSQPPPGSKSPRRGKHRRYVSGVFDQKPTGPEHEHIVTSKKEDKTWKKEVNNLGILDVIYSIFSEPKRKEGEPRLF